jgi:hypothetical protein
MRDEDWTDFGFGISDFGFCDLSTERRLEVSGSIPLTQNPKSEIPNSKSVHLHPLSFIRSAFPGRCPVVRPSRQTSTPFTKTLLMPSEISPGWANVERSST